MSPAFTRRSAITCCIRAEPGATMASLLSVSSASSEYICCAMYKMWRSLGLCPLTSGVPGRHAQGLLAGHIYLLTPSRLAYATAYLSNVEKIFPTTLVRRVPPILPGKFPGELAFSIKTDQSPEPCANLVTPSDNHADKMQ